MLAIPGEPRSANHEGLVDPCVGQEVGTFDSRDIKVEFVLVHAHVHHGFGIQVRDEVRREVALHAPGKGLGRLGGVRSLVYLLSDALQSVR